MLIEWEFLLAEIWGLLALATALGLFAGWIIWGGPKEDNLAVEEAHRLRMALEKERARARAARGGAFDDIPQMEGGGYVRPSAAQPTATANPMPTPGTAAAASAAPASAASQQRTTEYTAPTATAAAPPPTDPADPVPAQRPQGLNQPRDGLPDDLTRIKGIGAKMEKLCNELGFFHYDQIAAWTTAEIAWVDDNLVGFKGRVTRDNWVEQAKALAANTAPAFFRRTP